MPAGMWVNFEIRPHDEDFLPWFAGNGFGGVADGIVSGEVTVTDDFGWNANESENDDDPDGEGDIAVELGLSRFHL